MKLKFIATMAVVTVLFIGALIWLTNQFLLADRQSFAETQSRTSVSAVAEVIESEIRFLKNLAASADIGFLQRMSWDQMGSYIYVARIDRSNSEWKILEEAVKPNQPFAGTDRKTLLTDFNFQSSSATQGDYVQVSSFADRQKNQFVGYLIPAGTSAWLFIHQGESLQSLIDKQKLNRHTYGVIALNSMVVAHSLKEYVGQKISPSSLIQKMITEQLPQGSGIFKMDQNQSQYAYYERVPQTNIYVFSTLPLSALTQGQGTLWLQIGAFGLGFLLILFSLAAIFKEDKAAPLPPRPLPMAKDAAAPLNPGVPIVSSTLTSKERTEAYMKMASSIGHEMKSPLVHVLGYGQILLSKMTDPEGKAMVESLLQQAREGKDIVEKLFSFAGEKNNPKVKSSLVVPLTKALKNLEPQISLKKIKVTKDLQTTTELMLDVESLAKAFENILVNAIEAVEKQPQKEIKIKAEENSSGIQMTISDTGMGVDGESAKKVFDPFFSVKKTPQHMGLGLCTAMGIAKDHDGTMSFESKPNLGSTVKINFSYAPEIKNIPEITIPMFKDPDAEVKAPKVEIAKPEVPKAEAPQPFAGPEVSLNVNLDQLLSMPEPTEVTNAYAPPSATGSQEIAYSLDLSTPSKEVIVQPQSLDLQPKEEQKKTELDEFKFNIRRPTKRST